MAYPPSDWDGMAIFSTRNGKFAPRKNIGDVSIVVRSAPLEDRDRMVEKLRAEFPEPCKNLPAVPRVGDYFDNYDQELHGGEFLRAVLLHIVQTNDEYSRRVLEYVQDWLAANGEAFELFSHEHTSEHLFTKEDVNHYGEEFLKNALVRIRQIKEQAVHRNITRQTDQFGEHHVRIPGKHHKVMHSHMSNYARPSSNLSAAQTLQVTSNPDLHKGHSQPGPFSAISDGQHNTGGSPWIRSHISSPIHPSRLPQAAGNTDHVGMRHCSVSAIIGSYVSPQTGFSMPVATQQFPSPSTYRGQSRHPVSDRDRSSSSNYSKGKRNPIKRSSDDARRSSAGIEPRTQSFTRRASSNLGAFPMVQSPQPMVSSLPLPTSYTPVGIPILEHPRQHHGARLDQNIRGKPVRASYEVDEHRPSTDVQTNRPGRYNRDSHIGQFGPPIPLEGFRQPPIYQSDQSALRFPNNNLNDHQSKHKPTSLSSRNAAQSCDPPYDRQSKQEAPNHQVSVRAVGPMISGSGVPSTPLPQQSQPQPQDTPQHSYTQRSSGRKDGNVQPYTIWIGRIPSKTSKATISKMLEPCRGLFDISDPRVDSYGDREHAWIHAWFWNQDEAEEALTRIPHTCFPQLPKGTVLRAEWSRFQGTTPKPHIKRHKAFIGQNKSQLSPTKASQHGSAGDLNALDNIEQNRLNRRVPREATNSGTAPSTMKTNNDAPSTQSTAGTRIHDHVARAEVDPPSEVPPSVPKGHETEQAHAKPQFEVTKPVTGGKEFAKAELKTCTLSATEVQSSTYAKVLSRPQQAPNSDRKELHSTNGLHVHPPKPVPKDNNKLNRVQQTESYTKRDGGTSSKSALKSENMRPSPMSQATSAEMPFLDQAALPEHADDAARVKKAKTKSPKLSAVKSSICAKEDSGIQSLQVSSLTADAGEKTVQTTEVESLQMSPKIPSMTENALANPPDHHGSAMPEQLTDDLPSSGADTSGETPGPDHSISGFDQDAKEEPISQAMTREPSGFTPIGNDNVSTRQHSTAPTSYVQTERSNSLENLTQLGNIILDEEKPEEPIQKRDIDAEALCDLLQSDALIQDNTKRSNDTQFKTISSRDQQARLGTPSIPEPVEQSSRDIPKTLNISNPEGIAIPAPTLGKSERTSSSGPVDEHDDNNILTTALSVPPTSLCQYSLEAASSLLLLSNSEEKRLSSQSAHQKSATPSRPSSSHPISAPKKKRNKKKKSKKSKSEEEIPTSGAKTDSMAQNIPQSIDQDLPARFGPSKGSNSLHSAEVKISNQQRSVKPKGKMAKKSPGLVIEPLPQTSAPDRTKALPKPENPFQTDDGVSLLGSKPADKSANAARGIMDPSYTAAAPTKCCQEKAADSSKSEEHSRLQPSNCSDSPSTISGQIDTPTRSSPYGEESLGAALEEAGYQRSSIPPATSPFKVKDSDLARWYNVYDYMRIQDQVQDLREQRKERKLADFIGVTSEHLPSPSPCTPTGGQKRPPNGIEDRSSIKGYENSVQKAATALLYAKAERGEREPGTSLEDNTIWKGRHLLDISPSKQSGMRDENKWKRMASDYCDKVYSMCQTAPTTPTHQSRQHKPHHSFSSSETTLRQEERLDLRSPGGKSRPGSTSTLKPESVLKTPDSAARSGKFAGLSEEFNRKINDRSTSLVGQNPTSTPPQAVSSLTVSGEREKKIPFSPSARQGRGSFVQQPSTLASMKTELAPKTELIKSGEKIPSEPASNENEIARSSRESHDDGADVFSSTSLNPEGSENQLLSKMIQSLAVSEPIKQSETTEYHDSATQTVKKSAQPTHCRITLGLGDILTGQRGYQDGANVKMSQQASDELQNGLATTAVPAAPAPTPSTFVSSSDTSEFTQENRDDVDFPVLSRGGNRSVKGGKSVSPTRGGYAAAASKAKAKDKQHENKPSGNATAGDAWVVADEEEWGFKGSKTGKKRQRTF